MKKLVTITAIFLMFLVGCSNQENSIVSPNSTNVEQSAQVDLNDQTMTKVDETVIESGTVNKIIDGAAGGTISLKQNILSKDGQVVQVNADFEIPAKAFDGTQNITVTVDADSGRISFFPHMTFKKSCKLNFELKKVNLANMGIKPFDITAKFVYFDDSGSVVPVQNYGVLMFYWLGYVSVIDAKLDHFSRYGFIR